MSEEKNTNTETIETPQVDEVKEEETKEEPKQEETSSKLEELEKEIEALKKENEELIKKNDVLKNEYAKAYADTENVRKRLNNDFAQQSKYRIQSFALEILPVLDNCERALALEVTNQEDEKYRKGFEMVHRQLFNALKKEGVEEIDCLNKPFDPNFHQAMMVEHVDGIESGTVTEVLQKGYVLKDRLLRAAMVKISE